MAMTPSVLGAITESGGGRLHDGKLATEIRTVLIGELGNIFRTVVEDIVIHIKAPTSVKMEHLGLTDSRVIGSRGKITIGPQQNGRSQSVCARL